MLRDYETLKEEIKSKRREKGLSQQELADEAGVSKSLLGKFERGDNVPNYKSLKAIYDALDEKEPDECAEKFVTREIVSVKPTDKIMDASKIMKEKNFSQIPVKEGDNILGLILNNDIASFEDRDKPVKELRYHTVPRIPHNTSKKDFTSLFNTNNAVLVEKDNEVIGILTPADLL